MISGFTESSELPYGGDGRGRLGMTAKEMVFVARRKPRGCFARRAVQNRDRSVGLRRPAMSTARTSRIGSVKLGSCCSLRSFLAVSNAAGSLTQQPGPVKELLR